MTREKEIMRLLIKSGQKKSEVKGSSESMNMLIAYFRAGRTGRPLQTRGHIPVTAAIKFAWLAGRELSEKNILKDKFPKNIIRHNALVLWKNARFCQGRKLKPIF